MKKKEKKVPEKEPSKDHTISFHKLEGESDQEMIERAALAGFVIAMLGKNDGIVTLRTGPYKLAYRQEDDYIIEKRDGSQVRLIMLPISELKLFIKHYAIENPIKFAAYLEHINNVVDRYKEQTLAN